MSAVTKSPWFAIASATKARNSIILLIQLSFLSFACSPVQDTNIRTPARELYNQAIIASEDQFYTEAEELFRQLSNEKHKFVIKPLVVRAMELIFSQV